jgi:hypothetical protein
MLNIGYGVKGESKNKCFLERKKNSELRQFPNIKIDTGSDNCAN